MRKERKSKIVFFCFNTVFLFLFEVSRHKVPPHRRAAGVRAQKQAQKKERFSHPFGSFGGRTDPREVAQTANLFAMSSVQTITPQKQFFCGDPEKKCRGTKCRRTNVRQGYKPKTGTKKRTFSRSFWRLLRDSDPRHFG